ncbi:hypothetical protein F2Q69_00001992 [Brassica cretica]|uniref:RNase H type-1 domain-containing protein n=1 Tax=Brassica cretica TaxID=69181 RepID=A0A8S9PB49_BRACR|nr:hypothetical protein F2Q69_00001992 [Brassica cretica]
MHDALRDSGQWEEANNQSKQEDRVGRSCMHPHEEQEAVPAEYQCFCHVDASWKDDKEVAGVGCSLYSNEGTPHLQGSSSINPTNTPRDAETVAVQQMRRLAFKRVKLFE